MQLVHVSSVPVILEIRIVRIFMTLLAAATQKLDCLEKDIGQIIYAKFCPSFQLFLYPFLVAVNGLLLTCLVMLARLLVEQFFAGRLEV